MLVFPRPSSTCTLQQELLSFTASYGTIKHILLTRQNNNQNQDCDSDDSSHSTNEVQIAIPNEIENKGQVLKVCKKKKECEGCIRCAFMVLHLHNYHVNAFRNLYQVYRFVLTISSSQVQCERCFPKLKILKNRLRSNILEEHLEAL
jgi:hypothetical protein